MRRDIGRSIAVKRLNIMSVEENNNLIFEIGLMRSLDDHPNIVHYLGK
jgi:hypothetical protein